MSTSTSSQRSVMEESASNVGQFVHDNCGNRGSKIDIATSIGSTFRIAIDTHPSKQVRPGRMRKLMALHRMIRHAAECPQYKGSVHPDSGLGVVTWIKPNGGLPVPTRLWVPGQEEGTRIGEEDLYRWFMGE